MSFSVSDYELFNRIGWYPFYFPVADADGKVTKGCVLKPESYFQERGLNPKPYYDYLLKIHR